MFKSLIDRYQWHYVGTAHGISSKMGDDGQYEYRHDTYWIMSERGDEKRKALLTGSVMSINTSAHARKVQSQVEAWKAGGPMPEYQFMENMIDGHRQTAELIVFPGGKAG